MTLAIPYASCPVCNGEAVLERESNCTGHALWHPPLPTTLEWMRCTGCAHSFTRTYWSDQGLAEVFAGSHDTQVFGSGENPHDRRIEWAETVTQTIDLLGGYSVAMSGEQPVWIDIGCGSGYLAMLANETGFAELALDTRPQAVAALQAMAYNAVQGDFNQIGFTRPATVISMMDVLEHMAFPIAALQKARENLRPGGLLVVSLPSQTSSAWRALDRISDFPYWYEIEHHHNFSPDRLRRILEAVGFIVERVRYPHRYISQVEIYARRT